MKETTPRFAFLCLAISMVVALSASSLSAASPNHTRDTFVENFDISSPPTRVQRKDVIFRDATSPSDDDRRKGNSTSSST
jgi:hypothetical protein